MAASAGVAARDRARARRIALDLERVKRDERIEVAAAEFFVADDAVVKAISKADVSKARAVVKLADKEEMSIDRIAELVEVDPAEVRRLLKLGRPKTRASADGSDEDSGEELVDGEGSDSAAA